MSDPDFDSEKMRKDKGWFFEINILTLINLIKRFLKWKKGD
jgi:hypothetical protein